MPFRLYYWPGIPGRGEFVRLALEDAGVAYVDVGRSEGADAVAARLERGDHFAPPVLEDDERSLSHVAHILGWLGRRFDLAPAHEAEALRMDQLQLTVTDFVAEIHDTHHPIATGLFYDEQKEAARIAGHTFVRDRLPVFLNYFERTLADNPASEHWLVGDRCSTLDLSMCQVMRGLRYAFPKAMAQNEPPGLAALAERVADRPRLRDYLASPRCIAFNEDGVFRRYPELDEPTR